MRKPWRRRWRVASSPSRISSCDATATNSQFVSGLCRGRLRPVTSIGYASVAVGCCRRAAGAFRARHCDQPAGCLGLHEARASRRARSRQRRVNCSSLGGLSMTRKPSRRPIVPWQVACSWSNFTRSHKESARHPQASLLRRVGSTCSITWQSSRKLRTVARQLLSSGHHERSRSEAGMDEAVRGRAEGRFARKPICNLYQPASSFSKRWSSSFW